MVVVLPETSALAVVVFPVALQILARILVIFVGAGTMVAEGLLIVEVAGLEIPVLQEVALWDALQIRVLVLAILAEHGRMVVAE